MSKNKNGGLDQYGAEPSGQQQFGTAGVKGVKPPPLAAEQLNYCMLLIRGSVTMLHKFTFYLLTLLYLLTYLPTNYP